MNERQQPDLDRILSPLAVDDDELPEIETPSIDIQDLEHNAAPGTRVNNKGVKVEPRVDELPNVDEPPVIDELLLEEEDEKGREEIAKFEESIARLPPG